MDIGILESNFSFFYCYWAVLMLISMSDIKQIGLALHTTKDFTEANEDKELIARISSDGGFMKNALKECYDLFINILGAILIGRREKQ